MERLAWVKNYDSGFAPATAAELTAWGSDKSCGTASAPYSCYAIDDIEDTVNLGINYILKVGDGIPGGKVTVRIIPIVAADQTAPVWVDTTPPALATDADHADRADDPDADCSRRQQQ